MPKNPKQEKEGSVEEDQKQHGYYYDDAHGYEVYEPEKDDRDTAIDDQDDTEVDGEDDAEIDGEHESTKGAA